MGDRLRDGQHIVVGACGRVFDMISKRHLRVDDIRTLVIDEADDLVGSKSSDQVFDICRCLPPTVQICLSSATMTLRTIEAMRSRMPHAAQVMMASDSISAPMVKHTYVSMDKEEWKLDTLCDLYESLIACGQSIVFVNTRRKVDYLADQLSKRDFCVSTFHAELDQKERELVMREFRSGSSKVLITTDLLCRGIDVQQTRIIINYDLPSSPAVYLHQAGRSGRFGRKGVVVTFVAGAQQLEDLQALVQQYQLQVEEMPMDILDYF